MSALSREIGPRGRADAVVGTSHVEPEPSGDGLVDTDGLRSELGTLRVKALERRAESEGVLPDAVEDALDGDDPKASLIALIVDIVSSRGPAERMLSLLTTGGETAADELSCVLSSGWEGCSESSDLRCRRRFCLRDCFRGRSSSSSIG